jgi:NAD(P)-dependent dehydrogenase (short-subunit alcohol dehydrogenase family)
MGAAQPKIEGRRVVVTGTTSGRGAAMAGALTAAGASVGVVARPGRVWKAVAQLGAFRA